MYGRPALANTTLNYVVSICKFCKFYCFKKSVAEAFNQDY